MDSYIDIQYTYTCIYLGNTWPKIPNNKPTIILNIHIYIYGCSLAAIFNCVAGGAAENRR